MKKKDILVITVSILIGVWVVFTMTTCGDGGGDGDGRKKAVLPKGTFVKTALLNSPSFFAGHISNSGAIVDFRAQHLYEADRIVGSGYITAIELRSNDTMAAPTTCPDITIKMGHTSLSALTTTFADNVEEGKGSVETVLTNAKVVVPALSAGDYFTIQLDTPFYYNGKDNLVVDFIRMGQCDEHIPPEGDNLYPDSLVYTTNLAASTGSLTGFGVNLKFHFEGGVDTINEGSYGGVVTFSTYPFGGAADKVQVLYDASVINGSGPITGVAFRPDSTTTNELYTVTVRLGHSTLSDLTTNFEGNFSDTPVTVAQSAILNVPAGVPAGDYVWIPLPDNHFKYNGTDGLIVELDVSSASGTINWRGNEGATVSQTRAYGPSGASTATGTDDDVYHIALRYNGGTLDVITPGASSDGYPFIDTTDHKRQYLYLGSELGTKGKINKLALRMKYDSLAGSYPNLTVVMGHTSLNMLTPTFADNMDDAKTVYSGTFSLPAGLKAGDWIEIPLGSTFTYDPGKNLVVQTSASVQGSSDNPVVASLDTTLYNSRHLYSDDSAGTAGALNDYMADQRLWLKRE